MRTLVSIVILLSLAACGQKVGVEERPPSLPVCTAKVEWEYPIARLDGTFLPIEEIQKLTIYVAEAEGKDQSTLLRIDDVTASEFKTSHVITQLPSGMTYWFYLTVTDLEGIESMSSNELSKTCR